MAEPLFSLIPAEQLRDTLQNLQALTGISLRLLDSQGSLLMDFGGEDPVPVRLRSQIFARDDSRLCSSQSDQPAALICWQGGLTHLRFSLLYEGQLLGCVLAGPFLTAPPTVGSVTAVAQRYHLDAAAALSLYDDLRTLPVLPEQKQNSLSRLGTQLINGLLPDPLPRLQNHREQRVQLSGNTGPASDLRFVYEKEKLLLAKVRTGSISEVKALLSELVGHALSGQGGSLEAVRNRAIELTTLLSRVAMDGGAQAQRIYEMNSSFISRLYPEQDPEQLCRILQEVAESFMSCMFYEKDQGNAYIRKALRYMEDNYSVHLELPQVAAYVGLSPGYFSTLFRDTVGISFRDRLNRIRVEESKRLLLSTKYSLSDIAMAMGFPDQSYYCKVFKKLVGLTPGKFRS